MYHIVLNQFLDPAIVWLDDLPEPSSPRDAGQHLLALRTVEEARDVADQVLQLLDEGREMALILRPSLVT